MFIDKDKDHFKYGINQWTGEPNKPVFYTKEMAIKFKELIKDLENIKGDFTMNYKTIPVVYGEKWTKIYISLYIFFVIGIC